MTGLFAVMDATWPAAALHRAGPWLVREGLGGGSRVSAATAEADWDEAEIAVAEAVHDRLGQPRLFMIRDGETALDEALAARGYTVATPVALYEGATAKLAAEPPPPVSAFALWPMLAIQRDLWAEGGIGPARTAVMERARGPKTTILGRVRDRAAGTAYVAISGDTAMLHALHVAPELRRQGTAVNMMRSAARWAQDHGAERFSLVVETANAPANALYASLGMRIVGQYHYRIQKPQRPASSDQGHRTSDRS